MSKGKVLVSYLGRTGAGVLITYETAKALINNGFSVYILLSEYIEEKEIWKTLPAEKIEYICTYKGKFEYIINTLKFLISGKKKLKSKFENIEFDFQFMPMLYMWSGVVLDAFKCKRSFAVLHDVTPHTGTSGYVTRKFLEFSKKATDVIVHSPQYVSQVKSMLIKNDNRIHYYPLGDHTEYYNALSPQKKVITYRDDRINFLFFGTIMEYKGLGLLIDAYKELKKTYDNITLNIVGHGDISTYKEKLKNVEDVTIINRFINDNEVKSLYMGKNIITVTPYINATQSGPIMLAMGYKSLVITSDCTGLKNQVGDGKYGLIFEKSNVSDLVNKMKTAIDNPELREKLIASAFEHNIKNSWTTSIGRMMDDVL